jgi:Lar family restriction alleviation protein
MDELKKKIIESIIGEKLERVYLSRNAEKGGCYQLILNFENGISLTITGSPLCMETGIWEMIPAATDKEMESIDVVYSEKSLPEVDDKDVPPMPEVKEPPELKPCPFCGSDNVTSSPCSSSLEPGVMKDVFHCSNCGSYGPIGKNKEKAKMLWNSRNYPYLS